jgi:hypothetical protein
LCGVCVCVCVCVCECVCVCVCVCVCKRERASGKCNLGSAFWVEQKATLKSQKGAAARNKQTFAVRKKIVARKLGSDEHLSGPPQSDRVVVRPRRNDAVAHVDAPNIVSVPVKHVRATPVAPPPHSDRLVATAAHNDVAEHEDTPHSRDVPVKRSHKRPVLNVPHLRETDVSNARERVRTQERESARRVRKALGW